MMKHVSVAIALALCLLAFAVAAPQPKSIKRKDAQKDALAQKVEEDKMRWFGGYDTTGKTCGPWAFVNQSTNQCECQAGYHSWVQVGARMPDGGLYTGTSAGNVYLGCCPPWNGTVCKYTANLPFPYDRPGKNKIWSELLNNVTCDVDLTKHIEDLKVFVGIEHNQSHELDVSVKNLCTGRDILLQESWDKDMEPQVDVVAIFDDMDPAFNYSYKAFTLDLWNKDDPTSYSYVARPAHVDRKCTTQNKLDATGNLIVLSQNPLVFQTEVVCVEEQEIIEFLDGDTIHTRCCDQWQLRIEDGKHDPYYLNWTEYLPPNFTPIHHSVYMPRADGFLHGWGMLLKGCDPIVE